ncbi:MAG: aminodeoxychorismate lyase [Ferruginibacter sp.]
MSIFFNYNGKFYKEGTAIIGPDNRGLRYGDGLFETMKIKNGSIEFADDHFARLWKGMKLLGFEFPKHFSPDMLEELVYGLVKKNGHELMARIRLNIFRGDGGLYDAKDLKPEYIIQSWQLPAGNGEWNSNGLVLGINTEAQKSCDLFSNIKHNNYLPYIMAALKTKQEKWNDALLLNVHGRICDSTIANVFLIKDEQVFTAALTEGCVAGIMRQQLINILKKHHIPVTETAISIETLLNADEVFLTNCIYKLRWVQRIGERTFENLFTQKIFSLMNS